MKHLIIRSVVIMPSPFLFRRIVWQHFRAHKRDFPWRRTCDPYRILVSEVMLQQTQTRRVVQKYQSFLSQFPSWKRLAAASRRDVLAAWQGLGYNRRALALRKLAERVVGDYHGRLPQDPEILIRLPYIGPATAGAVCAFAFNKPVPFVETNIRRAYISFFFPRKKRVSDKEVLALVESTMDKKRPREWFWALMDYGAMLAKQVHKNPNQRSAHYVKQPSFAGSRRQLRGQIVHLLVSEKKLHEFSLAQKTGRTAGELKPMLKALVQEGFLQKNKRVYALAR